LEEAKREIDEDGFKIDPLGGYLNKGVECDLTA